MGVTCAKAKQVMAVATGKSCSRDKAFTPNVYSSEKALFFPGAGFAVSSMSGWVGWFVFFCLVFLLFKKVLIQLGIIIG